MDQLDWRLCRLWGRRLSKRVPLLQFLLFFQPYCRPLKSSSTQRSFKMQQTRREKRQGEILQRLSRSDDWWAELSCHVLPSVQRNSQLSSYKQRRVVAFSWQANALRGLGKDSTRKYFNLQVLDLHIQRNGGHRGQLCRLQGKGNLQADKCSKQNRGS